ncbi:MAG: hypothetical protein A2508_10595 [Candidatus Lambdaproteobacteria bacterium RIFOXYD12_FULL_49_8]|nr:MAG: hypothetical protein A2508_10595 [Candidatus Lambdaproteobacteria bacterium RIFOXYD12_FULL_49_8]
MNLRRLLGLFACFILSTPNLWAASCCGGGGGGALVLPKMNEAMTSGTFSIESYHGFWDQSGQFHNDPAGSDLNQTRASFGAAYRLAPRWQAYATGSWVKNKNRYEGVNSNTEGPGDALLGLWYEGFDQVTCVWKVYSVADLKPAIYWGLAVSLPTGISPYDEVANSFDITGRGFYGVSGKLRIEKTIYPFSAGLALDFTRHLERPVNREYGNWVEPYRKQLGDRLSAGFNLGYVWFFENQDEFSLTWAITDLNENQAQINQVEDPTTGMHLKSQGLSASLGKAERDWIFKAGIDQGTSGTNFPKTQTISIGVTYVFP